MVVTQRSRWFLEGEHAKLVIKAEQMKLSPVRNGRLMPVDELRELVHGKLRQERGE